MNKVRLIFMMLCCFVGVSCKKNPTDRLVNPLASGVVPISSGTYGIYDDELKTGGGLAFIPGGENQYIELDNPDAYAGFHSIRYEWNGKDVTNFGVTPNVLQHDFAGFMLTVTPDATNLTSANAKDLSDYGYGWLKFRIKATCSQETTLLIEGPTDGGGSIPDNAEALELSTSDGLSNWKEFSVPLAGYDLSEVRTFMTLTFQYSQPPRTTVAGNGGVVYLDHIRYE